MTKTDKRLYKPNNDSLLAKHLKVGSQTIYIWKRNFPEKYDLVKRGWIQLCSEINEPTK